MEKPEVKQTTNTTKKSHWLEVTECVCLVGSVAGTVASFLYQQAIYAAAPLTMALSIEALNRHRLNKLQQQQRQTAIAEVHQIIEAMPEPINKRLGAIENNADRLEQRLAAQNTEQTQMLDAAIAPILSDLAPVTGRLQQLSKQIVGVETFAQTLKTESQRQVEELSQKLIHLKAIAQTVESEAQQKIEQLTGELSRAETFARSFKGETKGELEKLTQQLALVQKSAQTIGQQTEEEDNKLKEAIANLHAELKALESVPSQIQQLLQRQEPLERQQQEIISQRLPEAVAAIERLKNRTALIAAIEKDIANISNEIEALTRRIDSLPEPVEPDMSKIEAAIASLKKRLDLHPLKLRGATLKGANLSDTYLKDAQLDRANLSDANICDCDLTDANLRSANLSGARLDNTVLTDAVVSRARLDGAQLKVADLSYSDFRGADMSKVDLSSANLRGIELSGANLSGVNLTGANLAEGNLSNVNLKGANLSSANSSSVVLANADLSGANLSNANLSSADLQGANLSNVNLQGANLWNANLNGANLTGVLIDDTTKLDEQSRIIFDAALKKASPVSKLGVSQNNAKSAKLVLGTDERSAQKPPVKVANVSESDRANVNLNGGNFQNVKSKDVVVVRATNIK